MSKRSRPQPGDVIEIPLVDDLCAYARIYRASGYAVFRRLVKKPFPEYHDILQSDILNTYYVWEDCAEHKLWPKIGHIPFRAGEIEYIEPFRLAGTLENGKYMIYDGGSLRFQRPDDDRYPAKSRLVANTFVDSLLEDFIGCPIWPTNEIFTRHYSDESRVKAKQFWQSRKEKETVGREEKEAKRKSKLAAIPLGDRIEYFRLTHFLQSSYPDVKKATRPIFRTLVAGLTDAKKAAANKHSVIKLFADAVRMINELDENGKLESGIDSVARDELCEALYFLGEAVDLKRESKFVDQWRTW